MKRVGVKGRPLGSMQRRLTVLYIFLHSVYNGVAYLAAVLY